MPMHNLLEHNDNCSMLSESLWNYYRDEVIDDANENNHACSFRINNYKATTSDSFECKTKITEKTPDNTSMLDTEVAVPLKYLSIIC